MVIREAVAKKALRSIYFWNNGFKPHNPFKYVIKLKFNNRMPDLTYQYTKYLLQDFMSQQDVITGLELRNNLNSAFVSFSNTDHMHEFLASDDNFLAPLFNENANFTKSVFEPRDITANTRPFNASVGLAYRPSLHSPGRITSQLLPFGEITGTETLECPYDPDRRIMYCSYFGAGDMRSSATQQPTILGKEVSLDGGEVEDVHVWKQNGMVMKDYGNVVTVRMGTLAPSPIFHRPQEEIIKILSEYGEIKEIKNWFRANILYVTFADPISVYKLFWEASPFGKVIKPVPNYEPLTFHINIPRISKEDKQNHSIDIRNVHLADTSEEELIAYCSDLLDSAGCNPGFISGVYSPQYKCIFLRLSNPWQTRDVSMKLDSFLQGVSAGRFKGLQTPIKSPFWEREPSVGNSLSSE